MSRPAKKRQIEWEVAILVLVAVKDEFAYVRDVLGRLAENSSSEDDDDLVYGVYEVPYGRLLIKYILAKLPHPSKGGDPTAWLATTLVERYRPLCLVMAGLCAGNPAQTQLGDVIIASSTVRSDLGKLEGRFLRGPLLRHRMNHIARDTQLFTVADMLSFSESQNLPLAEPPGSVRQPKIHVGLVATGNQVIKVNGAFQYLQRELLADISGDEYDRQLVGLDMEAHTVAFVAQSSKVPAWLVVKGVCDFADKKKDDSSREASIRNSVSVVLAAIEAVLPETFVKRSGIPKKIEELVNKSKEHYQQGRIIESWEPAKKAFRLGARSPLARRQYLRALLRSGEYQQALKDLSYFRSRDWYNDKQMLFIAVEILWRQGDYSQALELLPPSVARSGRQLRYMRAMNLIFSTWDPDEGIPESTLKEAQDLLKQALNEKSSHSPWWIHVNYVFTLLLDSKPTSISRQIEAAVVSIRENKKRAPRNGTIRLYELLLYALTDNHEEFSKAQKQDNEDLQIALDLVDMVLERLLLRYSRDDRRGMTYLSLLRHWVLKTVQLGKPVRASTAARLKQD